MVKDAVKYVKNPAPVFIEFALQPGELQTREGVVRYQAGDALATGAGGERWPIRGQQFAETYEPISPLEFGHDGSYKKRYLMVDAKQLHEIADVDLGNGQGTLHAKIGDWLLTAPNGDRWVVADLIFKSTYQAVDGEKP